jgi:hypothetical protein
LVSDIAQFVESLDLDAALARTYRRHDELRRRSVVRRRRTIGGFVAAVAAAVAIVVPLTVGGGPAHTSHIPAVAGRPGSTTTSLDPNAELRVPTGFASSDDGAIRTLKSTTPVPSDDSASPGVGASSAATERARVVSSSRGPVLRSVTVRFNCFRLPEAITEVTYTMTPTALVIDASLSYLPDARRCPSPNDGPVITLPLMEPLPVGLPVVAGPVPSH